MDAILGQLKSPMGKGNKRGSPRLAWEGGEPHTIRSHADVLQALARAWRRSWETGRYFGVASEGGQAANWHQHSGTRSDSLASWGWCWQPCCRLCWCYLETNNTTFICLAIAATRGGKAGCRGTNSFQLLFCPGAGGARGCRKGRQSNMGYQSIALY